MIYPGHNPFIRWFYSQYITHIVKRNFQQVNFNTIPVERDKAILLIANHYSWWDGFVFYYLNGLVFKKKSHVMILEDTIKRWTFMRHLGAFSVNKNSKDMLASLTYAAGLLNDPANLVLIFPQGELHSNFVDDVSFENGIKRVISQTQTDFQCILAASFTENFKYRKPTLNICLKSLIIPAGNSEHHIHEVYQAHYRQSKEQQTKIVYTT